MFNFMKKGVSVASGNASDREKAEREEKEKRKREKKQRKEGKNASGVPGSMSTEELLRLDEAIHVRRSLKIRGRRKEKEKLPSGITADYSAEFFAALNADASGGSELDRGNEEIVASVNTTIESRYNGSGSMNINSISESTTYLSGIGDVSKNRFMLPVPPKPPKRGILKGSRSNISNIHEEIVVASPDALIRNTMQNEMIFDGNRSMGGAGSIGSSSSQHGTSFTSVESLRSDEGGIQRAMTLPSSARYTTHVPHANLRVMTSPSPSADSLTDTTNSSFATPPFSLSPIGESQGIERWSRVQSFEDADLPLPPIKLVKLPPPRSLSIRRKKSPRQDFGFSLRKAICLDRSESLSNPILKPVIFAEPGAGGGSTGLLPGDRLLKVNGNSVCHLSRELIIEMIRNSGECVTVEVQPVSELVELSRRCMPQKIAYDADETDRVLNVNNCNTLKRSASKRIKSRNANELQQQSSQEENSSCVATNNGNDHSDRVWLVHRGGFCAALRLPQTKAHLDNHKVVIQLLHNGEEMTVDEDDLEKQNSPSLNLVEDISELKHLNEASVLHCLRQRFASNLIHTKAGPTLLVVNPMAPLSLYSEKVVSMFRGCKTEDMPPHIYSLAQTAYRAMLESRRDQSLIFMGRSGSGKTTSFKHALYYLALAAGSVNNFLNAEKVNSVNIILEAFGNAKTCLNANATRLTQLLSLDFDQSGQIASASLQVLLPERQRAGRRLNNEHCFHIMSRLLAGAAGLLQKELHIDSLPAEDNHPFVSLSQKLEERQRAGAEFMRAVQAFETLNIDPKAVKGIWSILASIYHLGLAGVTVAGSGPTARTQFANPSAARKASSLLGVSLEDLSGAAFNVNTSGSTSPSKTPGDNIECAWESLDALVIGLYSEALAAVVALINKAICTSAHTIASIVLVDTPGFQNPASCGSQIGANLSDLKHNYLQERLQLLFHHNTLVAPRDRYAQELVEIDTECVGESNPGPLVSLIDKAPQNHVVRSSQRDLREQDRRGLLWLLDEESIYPNSNDDTFLERLFSHYGDREHQTLLRKCTGPKQFVLQHLQGTNPVLYSVNGWVRNSREHPAIRNAGSLLQDSSKDEISRLYIGSLTRSSGGIVFCGSFAGLEGTQSLRRVSSIRRSFTSAGVKRNSIMLQVKFTVDGIIDTLRRTGTHFVHCYLLQHNAGQHTAFSSNNGSPNTLGVPNSKDDLVNVPLLRSQLRGSQVLDAARLHRLGFPESVPLTEFVRRFGLLVAESNKDITVEQILSSNEVDAATYRIGPSQILFRSGVLSELEAKRDELLSDRIIQLQACCRGYLARKAMAQRRVQELAVRCIQRNVKAFLVVRDWPWWRLLVRVMPLLNVHRTEEQLKIANEELLILRSKLERIEIDRSELKTENQKLESKKELVVTQESEKPTQLNASHTPETDSHPNNRTPTSDSLNLINKRNTNKRTKNHQTNNYTQNNEHEISNLTFLERVHLAMRSSKPLIKTVDRTHDPLNSTFNSSTSAGSLCKDGSNSSLSSNATNVSSLMSPPPTPFPRPPIPPKDPKRSRKQPKLISKQRERSPAQTLTKSNNVSARSSNYDSDDGLHHHSSKGVLKKSCNILSNQTETVVDSTNRGSSTVPVEVKLKLPFPKVDESSNLSAPHITNGHCTRSSSERFRLLTRSPSPAYSVKSSSSRASSVSSSAATSATTRSSSFSRLQTPPRRVFPQTYNQENHFDAYEMRNMEQSPVVFDANLSFVLGCRKQPVHQAFRPSPSFEDPRTASGFLSEKIQNFLRRTDHVQEEWTALGRRSRNRSTASVTNSGRTTPTNTFYDGNDHLTDTISLIERQRERNSMDRLPSMGRSKSSQNILTKAFQLSKTLPKTPTSRSNSLARDLSDMDDDDDDRTIQDENDNELDELSEMTVDLSEERSTANIATERLEAETGERLRLEKELTEKESKVKSLQESAEKLEMELICAKSDLNGISEEEEDLDNEESGSSGGIYKLKYERVAKELEFTKRRLQTQHEHDLEQLIGLKKQLEKKLSDAYEEVEEQRQVVGQWKRKAQKMTNEMNDLRMLLEEQNGRNNLLEKKQRKFDSECQALQDTARQERQSKERLSRENDVLIAEKFTLEQSLADTRLELDLKEEKLASLQRELEEMTFGGGTEEEIAQLRRSKNELDRRVKEQEEELDEMAGQVQLLEQAKLRLEMTLETMRKEARREAQQRDEELEEARGISYKKIKALECQLETEHEERTLLLREKHELERRVSSMEDQDRADRQAEEAANQKMRRDLRKYKALLKDAHAQLERLKADTPGKTLIRQLRNQLEDAESARTLAMKARQIAEADLTEVQTMYEESNRARNEAEDRANAAQRDRTELQAQIEENEEELAELMKKYSATVKQLNAEQIAASEYEFKLSELEADRNNLKEQVTELQNRLENIENLTDPSAAMMSKRLELRTKELESRLELEQATRARLEVQVNRHKEALERLQNDVSQAKVKEVQAQDTLKKSQKSLRELREEFHVVSGREQESVTKRKDLEKKIEQVESESSALKNDLRLALQRIADLQQAMEEGDDDLSDSEDSQTSDGSLSDLEDRLKPIQVRKSSLQKLNGGTVSSTTTLVREKADNTPRVTLTSPSSPHINKLALNAKKLNDDDPKQTVLTRSDMNSLDNGDVS